VRVKEKILLAMGPFGLPSRILTAKTGSILSFCSPADESAAPGHLSPEELSGLYRYAQIRAETPVFAVIGNPIMHSRSPAYHNPRFSEEDIEAVYVPVPVDDVDAFFQTAELIGMRGLSVTIPHKQAVIPYTVEREEAVERLSACNTLIRRSGGWYGCNTDVEGFLTPLWARLGTGNESDGFAGKKACVIGAGGAARAVVYALLLQGVRLCILNRSLEKAQGLAEDFGDIGPEIRSGTMDERGLKLMRSHSDLIVQTTSVGMHPDIGADPMPAYSFTGNEIVYDIVYNPEITRFLSRAREAGSEVISGMEMFDNQARLQYQLFREAARHT
jgi:3-dehydroquinate dehydratase/shikimate dehydrogenase